MKGAKLEHLQQAHAANMFRRSLANQDGGLRSRTTACRAPLEQASSAAVLQGRAWPAACGMLIGGAHACLTVIGLVPGNPTLTLLALLTRRH